MPEKKNFALEGRRFAVRTSPSDEEVYRVRAWAIYDERFQDYLDAIRMAADFMGDVFYEPPTRPSCPRPRQ